MSQLYFKSHKAKMKFSLLFLIIYLTSSYCEEQKVGGHKEIDVNDPLIEQLLTEHLKRLDTGDSGSFILISKTKVTQQVVSGINYQIHGIFKAGNRDEESCVVTIWNRAWLQDKNEAVKIKAECGSDNSKSYKVKSDVSEW